MISNERGCGRAAYLHACVVTGVSLAFNVSTSMEHWEAKDVSAGCQATCSRTLFVPGATAVCSGSAKSMDGCASFESLCQKGGPDLSEMSDEDEPVSIK